jgi:AraC family transcriptional regulator of adaptative response/methylated-DNA-[protein]-cysteine methyltransferase
MTPQTSHTPEREKLRFAYGDTTLGTIVVANSALGVVAPFIGDDRAKLLRDLSHTFPEIEFVLDPTGLEPTVAQAAALIDAPHLRTDLTLDLRGSPLELAVWQALQAIPAGETRTHGAIARDLPIAATAQDVGAACARSPCLATAS